MSRTKAKASQSPTSEHAVTALLRKRYPSEEWAFFAGLPNGTGYRNTVRRADAFALNTWPSRGLRAHGFEVKVSRYDWARELRNPAKSHAIQQYCDHWWIVTSQACIVEPGELPPTWGHMACDGGKLAVLVEAPKLESKPLDKLIICSILRHASKEIESEIKAGVQVELKEQAIATQQLQEKFYKLESAQHAHEARDKYVAEFEMLSGVKIGGWQQRDIAKAFRLFMELENSDLAEYARRVATPMEHAGHELIRQAEFLRQLLESPTEAAKYMPQPTRATPT